MSPLQLSSCASSLHALKHAFGWRFDVTVSIRTKTFSRQFAIGSQRLSNHLIHVVITIRRKPAYEVNIAALLRQLAVFRVNRRIRRLRDGIVRIAASLWKFI